MSVIHNDLLLSTDAATGYNLTKSLRFRSSATAYLSRTPASAGNRKTWTYSAWVKRGKLGSAQTIFGNGTGTNTDGFFSFEFLSDDTLRYSETPDYAVDSAQFLTYQVFRDASAWYHIMLVADTTQATGSNRLKLYVNGVLASINLTVTPTLNLDLQCNKSAAHQIGYRRNASTNYCDLYMAEVNFIDGQALTASSFGETDATTGVWKPKRFSGTYGTNGFYLPFTDVATTSGSNAGLGKDFSGNGNYWNTNNISVTAGTTYDSMTDVPTLTDASTANYAVLNPLSNNGNTISAANLNATMSTGTSPYYGTFGVKGTIGVRTGKWYWEIIPTSKSSYTEIGITDINWPNTSDAIASGSYGVVYYGNGSGQKIVNGAASAYGTNYASNDVIGVALDCDGGTITFYKNNSSQGAITLPSSSVYYTPLVANAFAQADVFTCNFGQQPLLYTPPTGFVSLNTYNLPDSTIVAGNAHFDATLYTGNGSTQSVTNAAGFAPGFVWIKHRNPAVAAYNLLYDKIRGVTKWLSSNESASEGTIASSLTAFNSNGFSVGADPSGGDTGWNPSSGAMIAWQWKTNGAGTSNTDGTITSTVSANPTGGFSVVTYTGNGTSGATIGHGLGVAPKMIFVKQRNSSVDWRTYHVGVGNTGGVILNKNIAFVTDSSYWNNTTPGSSVFTVGNNAYVNTSSSTYVAYCWTDIAGFSKFGSYTGNGSSDGPFIYCGFRPKWIVWKNASGTDHWYTYDTARQTYNAMETYLSTSQSIPESTGGGKLDIVANGFKIRNTGTDMNSSGSTYIYAAFAENPFKNSLAR